MYSIVCAILFVVGLMRNDNTLLAISSVFAIANGFEVIATAIGKLKYNDTN